jgi:hypothetical protein
LYAFFFYLPLSYSLEGSFFCNFIGKFFHRAPTFAVEENPAPPLPEPGSNPLKYNLWLLDSQYYKQVGSESMGGNAGVNKFAVNFAADPERGIFIVLDNSQHYSQEVKESVALGKYVEGTMLIEAFEVTGRLFLRPLAKERRNLSMLQRSLQESLDAYLASLRASSRE